MVLFFCCSVEGRQLIEELKTRIELMRNMASVPGSLKEMSRKCVMQNMPKFLSPFYADSQNPFAHTGMNCIYFMRV
jgi:hypothetical protein